MINYKNISTVYNIILLDAGENHGRTVEFIMKLNGKTESECNDLIINTPSIIDICDSFTEAQKVKKDLLSLGSKIDIEACKIETKDTILNNAKYIDCTTNNKLEIKCPNCSSTKTQKISRTSKVGSALAFGVFSLGKLTKTWECKACKYRW